MIKDIKTGLSRRSTLGLMGLGAAALVMPNLLVKPAFGQTPPDSPTGRVIVGVSQEPTVFNPLMPKIEVDDNVHFSVFDALFRIDENGEFVPNLATEVPTLENGGISEDGLEWRVRLRDDVSWHDGEAFTAEDVKYTLELIVNPDFKAWRTTGHDLVRDITVVSDTEITWRMEEPFAPYLAFLTETFIVPEHVLASAEDPNEAPFNREPIGTGAFRWGQRTAGDALVLVANPEYHGDGPYIEELIFRYIPDSTVLFTQFQSGDIDLVGRAYITQDNYEAALAIPDRQVDVVPASSVESIYLNLERPQFQDPAVREALYYALDRSAIIDILYYGLPVATETFMPRQSVYYNADLPTQEFNLDRAREILDAAGWMPGSDGIREKDGVRLEFNNSTTTGAHLREQTQQFVQQTFAEIGVRMNIENMPAAVMWGDFWTLSQFDSAMVGITYLIAADPDATNRLHTDAIAAQGGRGANTGQYSNPEVDALLDEGARTFDPEARRAIYLQVQEIIRGELPFLPLFSYTQIFGRKAGLEGFVPNANTRSETWNAASWYWN